MFVNLKKEDLNRLIDLDKSISNYGGTKKNDFQKDFTPRFNSQSLNVSERTIPPQIKYPDTAKKSKFQTQVQLRKSQNNEQVSIED
jgi:hypothetical protein